MHNPIPVFSRMPYTRLDLRIALANVVGHIEITMFVALDVNMIQLMEHARMKMFENALNPYKPSCRVIRQASIDYETTGRFIFDGEE